jgi:hypothetical protein
VLISSVETLRKDVPGGRNEETGPRPPLHPPSVISQAPGSSLPAPQIRLYPDFWTRDDESLSSERVPVVRPLVGPPDRSSIGADERPERGLARLVLTLIELLRQVVERQALRRVEGEGLSEEQVERMGVALLELEAKMAELREVFGLSEEDLNLDLGPLGRLL